MTVSDRDITGDAATTGRAHDHSVGAVDHTGHATARQASHHQAGQRGGASPEEEQWSHNAGRRRR